MMSLFMMLSSSWGRVDADASITNGHRVHILAMHALRHDQDSVATAASWPP
jgi:hypothetical protein